jgi:hypothetical protein
VALGRTWWIQNCAGGRPAWKMSKKQRLCMRATCAPGKVMQHGFGRFPMLAFFPPRNIGQYDVIGEGVRYNHTRIAQLPRIFTFFNPRCHQAKNECNRSPLQTATHMHESLTGFLCFVLRDPRGTCHGSCSSRNSSVQV